MGVGVLSVVGCFGDWGLVGASYNCRTVESWCGFRVRVCQYNGWSKWCGVELRVPSVGSIRLTFSGNLCRLNRRPASAVTVRSGRFSQTYLNLTATVGRFMGGRR